MRTFFPPISLMTFALLAATLFADDVAIDKLPKAVVDGLKTRFPGCEITKAYSETEDNKLVYEVSLKQKGSSYDVIITPEGKINVAERAIDAKDLPKAVSDSLNKKHPNAKIKLAEETSDGTGKVTGYEVLITTTDNKEVSIEFEPSGKIIGE